MRGVSTHLAPSGARGILIVQLFFASTFIWNAILLPSGDQAMFDGDFSTRVICEFAPSASM